MPGICASCRHVLTAGPQSIDTFSSWSSRSVISTMSNLLAGVPFEACTNTSPASCLNQDLLAGASWPDQLSCLGSGPQVQTTLYFSCSSQTMLFSVAFLWICQCNRLVVWPAAEVFKRGQPQHRDSDEWGSRPQHSSAGISCQWGCKLRCLHHGYHHPA